MYRRQPHLSGTIGTSEHGSRWLSLDGLRGVAILLVMVNHFTIYGMRAPIGPPEQLYFTVASAAWFGVDVLFVLSGFLITGILLDTKGSPHYFRNFYSRRALRIFPLYYGFLIAFFLVLPLMRDWGPALEGVRQAQGWYWTYLVNLPIAWSGWPAYNALAHFWSLAVEEQFYLAWPVMVYALTPRRLALVCLAAIVGALAFRVGFILQGHRVAAFVFTFARVDALALGACVAIALRDPQWRAVVNTWIRPCVGAACLLLIGLVWWRSGLLAEDWVVVTAGLSLLAGLSAVLIWELVARPEPSGLSRLLSHPILIIFGTYSYALYVFHHPLAIYMQRAWFHQEGLPLLWGSQLPWQALYLSVGILMSLALAVISWRCLEAPCHRLKRHFAYERVNA